MIANRCARRDSKCLRHKEARDEGPPRSHFLADTWPPPARTQLGRVPPAGVLQDQALALLCTNVIESSSNRSLLDSAHAGETHLRRVPIYGRVVAWVLDPPPSCQERGASDWTPLSCIIAFLALRHVPSFKRLFLTSHLLQPFFLVGPFLA